MTTMDILILICLAFSLGVTSLICAHFATRSVINKPFRKTSKTSADSALSTTPVSRSSTSRFYPSIILVDLYKLYKISVALQEVMCSLRGEKSRYSQSSMNAGQFYEYCNDNGDLRFIAQLIAQKIQLYARYIKSQTINCDDPIGELYKLHCLIKRANRLIAEMTDDHDKGKHSKIFTQSSFREQYSHINPASVIKIITRHFETIGNRIIADIGN